MHTLIYYQSSYYNFNLITILEKKYIPFYAYTFFFNSVYFYRSEKKKLNIFNKTPTKSRHIA